MRNFFTCLVLVFVLAGCVGAKTGTATTSAANTNATGLSLDQAEAGVTWLDLSAKRMAELLTQAKAKDASVAGKADSALAVVDTIATATSAFKNALGTAAATDKWALAKAAVDTAAQVALPIVVDALLRG